MSSFLVLALAATSALASPHAGKHDHQKHRHNNHVWGSGSVGSTGTGAPYQAANATGYWGTAAGSDLPVTRGFVASTEGAAASTSCSTSTTYVTTTNQVTVTIVQTASAVANSSTEASPVASESSVSSEYPSIALNVANKGYDNKKQRWTRKSTSSASSKSGKRGVAYNDATLCSAFEASNHVSWGYNWGQSSSGLSTKFNYVPLLWGTSSTFTDGWEATVSSAADKGVTHLMSFNEPDLPAQANISPEDAAAAYKKYMQPHAGKFKLGAPAVTNGAGSMGLNWLSAFLSACDGCTIDFVTGHWYDSPAHTDYFKEHVANISTVAGGKPVWLTEFGVTSGSDADKSAFLENVMPWMDSQDFIERYAYFMVSDGNLVSGSSASAFGNTYMSYSGSS